MAVFMKIKKRPRLIKIYPKNCPKCEGEPILCISDEKAYVKCQSCGHLGKIENEISLAIRVWNEG